MVGEVAFDVAEYVSLPGEEVELVARGKMGDMVKLEAVVSIVPVAKAAEIGVDVNVLLDDKYSDLSTSEVV